MIIIKKCGPYMVKGLKNFRDSKGKKLSVKPSMMLCRCGATKDKPNCDGTHSEIGFTCERKQDRIKDRVVAYKGKNITINDNRGVCSHDGACFRNLSAVFRRDKKRWIRPDAAGVEDIIETIEKCPSGALSYSLGGKRYQDLDRAPMITIARNGSLEVVGGIVFNDDINSGPEPREHYTLCTCGKSKNKPFCDGSHLAKKVGGAFFWGN